MHPHQVFDLWKLYRAQWRDPAAIRKIQEIKLRRLVRHAYHQVPYYRDLFDACKIRPEDIRGLEDLAAIPLTDKRTLQKLSLENACARNIPRSRCRTFLTSGSTGRPLTIVMTTRDLTLRNLVSARANMASGLRSWHKIGVVIQSSKPSPKRSWYEFLGFWRRKELSAYATPDEWLAVFSKWGPQVLVGRMTTLKLLAEAAERTGDRRLRPKLLFSSAEMLDEGSRRYMAGVFGAKVLDYYYSFEGGCLAWECESCGGYHVNSDSVILEILDTESGRPAAVGEPGEVVITNLQSQAMPFIRYRQGDLAVLSGSKPVCGRPFPLIESIQGRKEDLLVLPSGRKIPSQPVATAFLSVPGIKAWRVIQDRPDRLLALVERDERFTPDVQRDLIRELKKMAKEDVDIEVKLVDSIPLDPQVKFRSIYSTVAASMDSSDRRKGKGQR